VFTDAQGKVVDADDVVIVCMRPDGSIKGDGKTGWFNLSTHKLISWWGNCNATAVAGALFEPLHDATVDGVTYSLKDVRELQDETVREGMDGISPRYIIDRLSNALIRQGVSCINPINALRALRDGFDQHTAFSKEERERYLNLLADTRREYDELAKKEVQRAFVYAFEESARTLLNNYLDNVEAFCRKEKIKDPLTDEPVEPDEKLMRSIEEQTGVTEGLSHR